MKLSTRSTHIYILYDPTFVSTKFYVGKTEQRPAKRLSSHLKKSNLQKNYFCVNWIKSLLARNVKPSMYIFATIPPNGNWEYAERSLISFLRWCGIEITNTTEGGEGGKPAGWHHTEETKQKMSNSKMGKSTWNTGLVGYQSGENNPFFGKTHTQETKEILRQKAIGRKASLEIRQKMSISNKDKGGWNKGTDATTKYLPIMCGESNPASKITREEVIKIRDLYAVGNHTFVELSKLFNISNVSIANIVRRKTWANI